MTSTPDVSNPVQSAPPAWAPPQHAAVGRKVSAPWTGALMALGCLAAAVATMLPFEKIIVFRGSAVMATATFTGLGSKSATGVPIDGLKAGNAGMIILVASLVALVCGVVVLLGKGRLWASIVGLVAVAGAGVLTLATFAAASDDQKKLNATADPGWSAHALTKLGPVIAAVGLGLAALGAILAIVVRRRRAA